MNKLTRYNLAEIARTYSSDKHSVVCTDYDVERLEALNAELLEACKGLLGIAERHGWLHVAVDAARAAIAKAEGGEG